MRDFLNPPYDLKPERRRMEDAAWGRRETRMLEGFGTLAVQIHIEMLNRLDVLFGSRVHFRFQWIQAEVDVTAIELILVLQPVLEMRACDPYGCADALESLSSPSVSQDHS
jgi:hypothetical protein